MPGVPLPADDDCPAVQPIAEILAYESMCIALPLPLNASQKIEKFKLRLQAAEFPETLWDREKASVSMER